MAARRSGGSGAGSGARAASQTDATTLVVVSDLHLGDGDARTENWRAGHQAAWERLLRLAPELAEGGPLDLVLNGDTFDLLQAAPPLDARDDTDAAVGVAKLERIIAAHPAWFAALRAFLAAPGRTATFTTGNHDVELAFAPVRSLVRRAIGARVGAVRFCRARVYQPLPEVVIEHGCQTDPWNRIYDLWDAPDMARATTDDLEVDTPAAADRAALPLPFGSCYQYQVYLPIQRRLPYFDSFLPSLPQAGVVAMVCLYAPDLVVEAVRRARRLFMRPENAPAAEFGPEVAGDPARLYEAVLPFVAALQADVWERAGVTAGAGEMERMIAYVLGILAGLAEGEQAGLRAIFAIPGIQRAGMPLADADAAQELFAASGAPAGMDARRVGLIGHTHVEGAHALSGATEGGERMLINTGTWYTRLALPRPEQVDERLAAWLRDPVGRTAPIAPATAFSYALVRGGLSSPACGELRRVAMD